MELYVYSRQAIEMVAPHEVPHIVISITSGVGDVARIRANDMCLGILRLVFLDAEEPSETMAEADLFSREHAKQILSFVQEYRFSVERILIHCDAGVSRSAGVGAALALLLNDDEEQFFTGRYRANQRVYRTILEEDLDSIGR